MTCKKIADRVTDYYEGALSSSEAREIETHLEICEKCRMHFEHMRQLISAMGKLPEKPRLSPNSRAHIMEAFREYHSQQRIFGIRRTWTFASAGVIAIAVLAVVVWIVRTHTGRPTELRAATLDLTDRAVLRGPDENPPKPPLQLPRDNLNLNVYLPVGSEPGKYEIEVADRPDHPLVKSEGSAVLRDHIAVIQVNLNLQPLRPGLYMVGIRQAGWSWTYYPVVLK
jgi:hypothetical protein